MFTNGKLWNLQKVNIALKAKRRFKLTSGFVICKVFKFSDCSQKATLIWTLSWKRKNLKWKQYFTRVLCIPCFASKSPKKSIVSITFLWLRVRTCHLLSHELPSKCRIMQEEIHCYFSILVSNSALILFCYFPFI